MLVSREGQLQFIRGPQLVTSYHLLQLQTALELNKYKNKSISLLYQWPSSCWCNAAGKKSCDKTVPLLSSGNQRSKEEERKIHQVKKFRTCPSSFPFVQGWFQFPTELMLTNLPLSHFALYWLWCELAPWQITWSNRDPRGINSIQTANSSFALFVKAYSFLTHSHICKQYMFTFFSQGGLNE